MPGVLIVSCVAVRAVGVFGQVVRQVDIPHVARYVGIVAMAYAGCGVVGRGDHDVVDYGAMALQAKLGIPVGGAVL